MVPTKMTDLLPQSLADWLTGRRRATANGSLPPDTEPRAPEREEDRPPAPPAKRARFEGAQGFYAQPEATPPPIRLDHDPLTAAAGPSGYKAEAAAASPPVSDTSWQSDITMFGRSRTVTRHSLGKRSEDKKISESPLKPQQSPVRQTLAPAGSPFYPGRTRYGGSSSTYIDEPNVRDRRTAVPSRPLCTADNTISATTRRLMGILERCSTPNMERKPQQVRADATNLSLDSSNLSLMGKTIGSSFNSNKTQELHMSHLPTLLKLRQGARLRESTRAARRLADAHAALAPYPAQASVRPPAPETPSTSSLAQDITSTPIKELSKQTNKIKPQIGRTTRKTAQILETEVAPPLNLPSVTLNIDHSNLPKFSFAPAIPVESKTTEKIRSFKFSLPQIVTQNHISVPSDIVGFKFSKPADITEKKLTNGPFSSTPLQSWKPAQTGWTCADCWVSNKESDEKCCACTAPRPGKKPEKVIEKSITNSPIAKVSGDWKCKDCWIMNKDNVDKCLACGGSKPGPINKAPEKIVKDWKCNDCWISNKDDVEKCIACGGAKPGSKLTTNTADKMNSFEGITKKPSNKWTCKDCWVSNDNAVDKCVACGGANPNKPEKSTQKSDIFSDLVKKQNELWECPSCLTRNNNSVSKCVCCEATRPGSRKNEDTKFNFSPTPAFKFGIPSAMQSEKTSLDDKPKELIESNNNTTKSVTFTFGVPKPIEDKNEKKEQEPPKFSFGVPKASTDKPEFKFGSKAPSKLSEEKSEIDGNKQTESPVVSEDKDKKEPAFKLPTMGTTGLFSFTATTSKDDLKTTESKEPTSQTTTLLFNPPKSTDTSSVPIFAAQTRTQSGANTLFGIPSNTAKIENSTAAIPSVFVIPSTAKTDAPTLSTSSTLFTIPSTTKSDTANVPSLFGIPSVTKSTAESTNLPTLFGVQSTAKSEAATTTTASLFEVPSAVKAGSNASATLFGIPATTKTELNTQSSTLFGVPAKTDSTPGTLFGVVPVSKPETTKSELFTSPSPAFSLAKTESTVQNSNATAVFTFGASNPATTKSSKFNFTFGSTSKEPSSTFNTSFGSNKIATPAFGTPTTQASLPAFGTLTTQQSTVPTFGATTQSSTLPTFGATTQSSNLPNFGVTTQSSTLPTFGSLTTQANAPAFGLTTQSNPTFGAPKTQANTLFGANTQPAFGTANSPAFGAKTQASTFGTPNTTPTFGTPTTQPPAYGAPSAQPPAFGTPTTQPPAFGTQSTLTFGASSTPTFGAQTTQASNTFAPPNVNLFASNTNTTLFGANSSTANKPFTFGSTSGSNNTMFGNQPTPLFGANQQNTSTELFPSSNQSMFNSSQQSVGMFGSTQTFGANQTNLGQNPAIGQNPAMGQSIMGQTAQPQPFNFGSPNTPPVFQFGQQSAQPAAGVYNFSAGAAPNVQFSLGSSAGTPQSLATVRRPVRRAVRRTQR